MILTVLMAALTWLIPAGQYQMEENQALGRMVPVVGSYHSVEANPQTVIDIIMHLYKGSMTPPRVTQPEQLTLHFLS